MKLYDLHTGPKMLWHYDTVQPVSSKASLEIYRNPQSKGPDFHKAKLGTATYEKLLKWVKKEFSELYQKYLEE